MSPKPKHHRSQLGLQFGLHYAHLKTLGIRDDQDRNFRATTTLRVLTNDLHKEKKNYRLHFTADQYAGPIGFGIFLR